MAADRDIQPGQLSPGDAAYLNAAVSTGYRTQAILDATPPPGGGEWMAVQLTSCDTTYTPARCAWKRRAWGTTGARIDHPNGQTGTVTASPALLIGNGAVPPLMFPVDVWARRAIVATTGTASGQVLEVEWNCACAAGGSGLSSGGEGGTDVVTDCGTYSTVLVMTVELPAACGGGSAVIDLEWDGTEWAGTGLVCDAEAEYWVECIGTTLIPRLIGVTPGDCTVSSMTSTDFSTGATVLIVGTIEIDCTAGGGGVTSNDYHIVEG